MSLDTYLHRHNVTNAHGDSWFPAVRGGFDGVIYQIHSSRRRAPKPLGISKVLRATVVPFAMLMK